MSRLSPHNRTGRSVLCLLLFLFGVVLPAEGRDKTQPGSTDHPITTPRTFNSPGMPPDIPQGFLIGGDDFSSEFLPEGIIWNWEPGDEQFAFWVAKIRGSRGQVFWTRSKESLFFGLEGDRVQYKRTSLISEMYEGDRKDVTQIWHFLDNPAWEGGDLIITGEILTVLTVRNIAGRIQFYDRDENWLGPFFRIIASDVGGRILELSPILDGKTVTLTIPATWLYEIGSVQIEND